MILGASDQKFHPNLQTFAISCICFRTVQNITAEFETLSTFQEFQTHNLKAITRDKRVNIKVTYSALTYKAPCQSA